MREVYQHCCLLQNYQTGHKVEAVFLSSQELNEFMRQYPGYTQSTVSRMGCSPLGVWEGTFDVQDDIRRQGEWFEGKPSEDADIETAVCEIEQSWKNGGAGQ